MCQVGICNIVIAFRHIPTSLMFRLILALEIRLYELVSAGNRDLHEPDYACALLVFLLIHSAAVVN